MWKDALTSVHTWLKHFNDLEMVKLNAMKRFVSIQPVVYSLNAILIGVGGGTGYGSQQYKHRKIWIPSTESILYHAY